jgi:hypothetical protein
MTFEELKKIYIASPPFLVALKPAEVPQLYISAMIHVVSTAYG